MDDAVVTSDLAAVIREAVEAGETIRHLAARAGVSERKIDAILRVEYRTTSLTTADKVIEALGQLAALVDGSVRLTADGRSRRGSASPD